MRANDASSLSRRCAVRCTDCRRVPRADRVHVWVPRANGRQPDTEVPSDRAARASDEWLSI